MGGARRAARGQAGRAGHSVTPAPAVCQVRRPRPTRSALARPTPAPALAVAAIVLACASQGMPPGGPPDTTAPVLLKITPESGSVGATPRAAEFTFDEVVSERPRGAPDLRSIVVISPGSGKPEVDWARNRIVVRPRGGWRQNTAYAVTILPGLTDLRTNATTTAFRTVFATGNAIPDGAMRGAAFDWMAGKPAPRARIDATIPPDTILTYSIAADSLGWFALGTLPPARYLVRAWIDANNNGTRDPREPWDTATVTVVDSARHDFYMIPRDTLGAHIAEAAFGDSTTIRLKFDHGLRGAPPLVPSQVTVRRYRDSSAIAVGSVATAAAFDSAQALAKAAREDSALRTDTTAKGRQALARRDSLRIVAQRDSLARAQIDSLRAMRDTAKKAPAPVLRRPVPPTEFVIVLAEPVSAGEAVRLTARDVQAVVGHPRSSDRVVARPRPAPRDTTQRRPPPGGT